MRALVLMLLLVLAGCAQTVTLQTLPQTERVPKREYVGYVFSAGENEHLRAVFLKIPTMPVTVEASSRSVQIMPMSYEQAVDFVRRRNLPETLDIQTVRLRGDIIGYLLTYVPPRALKRADEWLEVRFYERDGTIHFVIDRKFRADG